MFPTSVITRNCESITINQKDVNYYLGHLGKYRFHQILSANHIIYNISHIVTDVLK